MEITLRKAEISDVSTIVSMQKRAFSPLYEIYRDEGNPALEEADHIIARMTGPGSCYYLILGDGKATGAIRVKNTKNHFRIAPVFILPEYQKNGIGSKVLELIEALYPEAESWNLDTIKQETKLCRFYEKAGYQRTGEEMPVKENMTLVMYEKQGK